MITELGGDEALVLALYFKDRRQTPFEPSHTQAEPFSLLSTNIGFMDGTDA